MDFTIKNTTAFENANEAFKQLYRQAHTHGLDFDGTKAMFNVGFYLLNPMDNHITVPYRNWNPKYANREWTWYLSGDPSAVEISKFAPIWKNMMDEDGKVRSNYGWQWGRKNQLEKIVDLLHENPNTRKAAISIYDGKEIKSYKYDTPCTYAIQFTIIHNRLNMSVYMRSNDIWYGFCNDQYCFSMLQQLVADSLNIEIGWYYHHAHNMHLYNAQLEHNL